jgi:hypothetical protein
VATRSFVTAVVISLLALSVPDSGFAQGLTPHTSDKAELTSESFTARTYYLQLYKAGGFFRSISVVNSDGRPGVVTLPYRHYVCFNDDARSQVFFAFSTTAYDERFAKAWETVTEPRLSASANAEAWQTVEAIRRDNAAYVELLDRTTFNILPASAQEFLRKGGRVLDADFYRRGVKSGGTEYQWDGNSWVVEEVPDSSAYVKTTKTFRLSIEPATLRYIERVTITTAAGSGNTMASDSHTEDSELGSGTCEQIPSPDQSSEKTP